MYEDDHLESDYEDRNGIYDETVEDDEWLEDDDVDIWDDELQIERSTENAVGVATLGEMDEDPWAGVNADIPDSPFQVVGKLTYDPQTDILS